MIDSIYHYTSLLGFKGIVENKKNALTLWFTHYKYLNDASEGFELEKIVREAAFELRSDKEISCDYYEKLKEFKVSDIRLHRVPNETGIPTLSAFEDDFYICCFSQSNDKLEMWRYYSKGDIGLSLRFRTDIFSGRVLVSEGELDDRFSISELFKVIYDDKEKKKRKSE